MPPLPFTTDTDELYLTKEVSKERQEIQEYLWGTSDPLHLSESSPKPIADLPFVLRKPSGELIRNSPEAKSQASSRNTFRGAMQDHMERSADFRESEIRSLVKSAYVQAANMFLGNSSGITSSLDDPIDEIQEVDHVQCYEKDRTDGRKTMLAEGKDLDWDLDHYDSLIGAGDFTQARKLKFHTKKTLRTEFLGPANRLVCMITIVARLAPKSPLMGSISSKKSKSYLEQKVSLLHKVLSELNSNKPFHTIPINERIELNAFYETKKNLHGALVNTRPHYHVLIYSKDGQDLPGLSDPKKLGHLLQKLSSTRIFDEKRSELKEDEEFLKPLLHVTFPNRDTNSQCRLTNYCTKYLSDTSVLSSDDLNTPQAMDFEVFKSKKRMKGLDKGFLQRKEDVPMKIRKVKFKSRNDEFKVETITRRNGGSE